MIRRDMALGLVVLACASGLTYGSIPQAAGARSYQTIDLMPLFWSFWDRARAEPVPRQIPLFKELVAARRPEVYNAEVLGIPGGKSLDAALPEQYPKSLEWTSPHFDIMRSLSEEVGRSLPAHDAEFRRTFPDFSFDGRVYFMYSIGAFDGAPGGGAHGAAFRTRRDCCDLWPGG